MMYALANAFALLDVHLVVALERWRARIPGDARRWFRSLGRVEAMCALATLAHDHPGWAFPELVEGDSPLLDAEALGHPLIADDRRVPNDVSIGAPEPLLLVTGSNMSGKTTLVRALGVNAVLAQCGAPVCARRMRLTPVAPWTSMRVHDSLAEGVSLFMAELLRLKQVVEAAREASATGAPPVLFLLDEMLHGTNTAERQVAARSILAELMARGAIGAVTTHDLALAEADELAEARTVHFSERFETDPATGETRMAFDYVLRPGVATSTNALKLVEMLGLGPQVRATTSGRG
jgi:DNA mismatch repair ATPase MutS